ncbi:MAG: hypothetical protein Kow0037_32360 [Calditrichia bacterium]
MLEHRKIFRGLEASSDWQLQWGLALIYGIFYLLQVQWQSPNADVLVYALRSAADRPILDFAFLDAPYIPGKEALPNYHLGHTVLLWLVYHLFPEGLRHTLLPGGIFSALCGALVVGSSYRIWRELRFEKKTALLAAAYAGLIPSIWFHSLIGEVYIPQLLSILLFLLYFLQERWILSAFFFLLANLISPVSALSFSFILFRPVNAKRLGAAVGIGLSALIVYLAIFKLLQIDLWKVVDNVSPDQSDESLFWKGYTAALYILLNFNFFIWWGVQGLKEMKHRFANFFYLYLLALAPQLLLWVIHSQFLVELGSFQLPLFWALSLPVALCLEKSEILSSRPFKLAIVGLFLLTLVMWHFTENTRAQNLAAAGNWVARNVPEEVKIIGNWTHGFGVSFHRYGWNLSQINRRYLDVPTPGESALLESAEPELLLVHYRRHWFREWLARLPGAFFRIPPYKPLESVRQGTIEKVYENGEVIIYRWKRKPAENSQKIEKPHSGKNLLGELTHPR